MKRDAFTLIELLGVIIILGLITLVSFPPLLKQIKQSRNGLDSATSALIIDAAKDYYYDNSDRFQNVEGLVYCLGMNSLFDGGYINEKIKDKDLEDISKLKSVRLIYTNGKFNYEIVDSCDDSVAIRNNVSIPIVDGEVGLNISKTDENRLIYRGTSDVSEFLNNYIWLDENGNNEMDYDSNDENVELYRIVSFEKDGTIKVVRDKRIVFGSDLYKEWDEAFIRGGSLNYCGESQYGCNAWGTQSDTYMGGQTFSSLNENYYLKYYPNNMTNAKVNTQASGLQTVPSTLNSYLNTTWINSLAFRDYISNHLFASGGIYYSKKGEYFGSDKGIKKEKDEEQTFHWMGKVALLNVTEYVESSLNNNCTSVWSNYFQNPDNCLEDDSICDSYSDNLRYQSGMWPCSRENWNYREYSQWLLTVRSNDQNAIWVVTSNGDFDTYLSYSSNISVRPSFYLKASVKLMGDGSLENPYRIVGDV
jgi:competence protein ComGC